MDKSEFESFQSVVYAAARRRRQVSRHVLGLTEAGLAVGESPVERSCQSWRLVFPTQFIEEVLDPWPL